MFNRPLKFLNIPHQTHSFNPFCWNKNIVNTRSIPNYAVLILLYAGYILREMEMHQIKLEHRQCYISHNLMTRMNTICTTTLLRESCLTVGMGLVQHSFRMNIVYAPCWGQPVGEDCNVSSVNSIQFPMKKCVWCCRFTHFKAPLRIKVSGEFKKCYIWSNTKS